MANSCAINPYLKREGKVVPSELWENLKKYHHHIRKTAVNWYGIATDEEFLDYIEKAGLVKKEYEIVNGRRQIAENDDFDKNGQLRHGVLLKIIQKYRKVPREQEEEFRDKLAKAVWRTFNPQDKSDLKEGIFTDYNDNVIAAIKDFHSKYNTFSYM